MRGILFFFFYRCNYFLFSIVDYNFFFLLNNKNKLPIQFFFFMYSSCMLLFCFQFIYFSPRCTTTKTRITHFACNCTLTVLFTRAGLFGQHILHFGFFSIFFFSLFFLIFFLYLPFLHKYISLSASCLPREQKTPFFGHLSQEDFFLNKSEVFFFYCIVEKKNEERI